MEPEKELVSYSENVNPCCALHEGNKKMVDWKSTIFPNCFPSSLRIFYQVMEWQFSIIIFVVHIHCMVGRCGKLSVKKKILVFFTIASDSSEINFFLNIWTKFAIAFEVGWRWRMTISEIRQIFVGNFKQIVDFN